MPAEATSQEFPLQSYLLPRNALSSWIIAAVKIVHHHDVNTMNLSKVNVGCGQAQMKVERRGVVLTPQFGRWQYVFRDRS